MVNMFKKISKLSVLCRVKILALVTHTQVTFLAILAIELLEIFRTSSRNTQVFMSIFEYFPVPISME